MESPKDALKPINLIFFFWVPFLCFKNDHRDLFENILKKKASRIKRFVGSFSLEQNLIAEL